VRFLQPFSRLCAFAWHFFLWAFELAWAPLAAEPLV
jgi:hypothetical protein